ncbi:MAG: DUF2807 domain-containing protein [Muribaculum sp.]|nr:DUF2807 domain-containing protein [Muribaculaceae bacterium]MCM1080597.1 DUF2807 domain-containing protein [Muribaculum sp.]
MLIKITNCIFALLLFVSTATASSAEITTDNNSCTEIKVANFKKIDANNAKIKFTQGKKCRVYLASANRNPQMMPSAKVGNGILKISANLVHSDTIFIEAPRLERITVGGFGSLTIGALDTDDLTIQNTANSGLKTGDIKAKSITIDCGGFTTYTSSGTITAKKVILKNSGTGNIKNLNLVADSVFVDMKGFCTILADMKCKSIKLKSEGTTSLNGTIAADNLMLDCSGFGEINIKQQGKNVNLINSGTATANMTVNCENLFVNNSGFGSVTIEGVADSTKIINNGVSNINVKELNKF